MEISRLVAPRNISGANHSELATYLDLSSVDGLENFFSYIGLNESSSLCSPWYAMSERDSLSHLERLLASQLINSRRL